VLKAANGETVRTIGSKGPDPGQFLYPMGLALDSSGQLYVVDQQKMNFQIFSTGGAFVQAVDLVVPKELVVEIKPAPVDIEISPKTGEIFISDRGLNRIWVFARTWL
jgi:DNA-binding beta-propeller fold protein YncE